MLKQQSLFAEPQIDDKVCFHTNIANSGFEYEEVSIGDITFKAGQSEPIHRWYRLTPSYSPNLVRFLIDRFDISKDDLVLDPFSGRGTTVIECQKLGLKSVGIEINPLLQEVGDRSLLWESNHLDLIDSYLAQVGDEIRKNKNLSIDSVLKQYKTELPIIHNVFRWWQEEVLKELIIHRQIMLEKSFEPIQNYLWIAINKAALDCANIHRNHPTITFDDNHTRKIDVQFEIQNNLQDIKEDIKGLTPTEISNSRSGSIILGNSTKELETSLSSPVDFVITSPPYPNRYSYVHQTRPQLYFMELIGTAAAATDIDLNTIGGTWGKATSGLQKKLMDVPEEIRPYLSYYDDLKEQSTLMCNYATKYFIDLWEHIKSLKKCTTGKFRGAYVVGNSRLSGIEIFTEVILGNLFEHEQLKVEKIISFRKRGGRQRLYETAVCVKN